MTPEQPNPEVTARVSFPAFASLLRHPTIATVLPLLAGGLLTAFVFQEARLTENQRIRAEFLKEVEHHMGVLRGDLIHANDALFSLRNLFQLAAVVQPSEFSRVANDLITRHPAIRSLMWVPRIAPEDRSTHISWARRNITGEYHLHRRNPDGSVRTLSGKEEVFPVFYQAPAGEGEPALGEDLSGVPEWAAALRLSREVARVTLSPRLPDRNALQRPASVLAVAPVYEQHSRPETLADRQRLSSGFLVAEINVASLIERAIGAAPNAMVNVVAHDVSNNRESLLHTTLPYGAVEPTGGRLDTLRRNGQTESLTLAARAWRLRFTPSESWIASVNSQTPQLALLACVAFTALSARLLRTVARRNQRIETQVAERTAALLQTNRRLQDEIEHRETVERERKDSEERFRITFEEAPAGIGHTTLEGRYTRVNDRLCEITGYSRPELLERQWQQITHPDDIVDDEDSKRRLLRSGGAIHSSEMRFIRKDGSFVWVNLTVALVRDGEGQPSYLIFIVTDQTESRLAAEALESERNLLRTLIDGLPDSVYIKDRDGRYVLNNLAKCRLLGIDHPDDAAGRTSSEFAPLSRNADLYHRDDQSVIESGRAIMAREEPFTLPDGSEGCFSTTKLPLRNSNGEIIGIIGITADITRRKRDEMEKLRMTQKLESTQKLEAMGLLAGGIAHDFNNLLTGIHGHAGLLRLHASEHPDLLTHISQIEESARRASELCQQMLDYSGQNRHERQRLDLNATIKQTLPLIRHSIGKRARFSFEPAENLPAIEAAPSQFRQIVMNLVINASDAIGNQPGNIQVVTGVMRALPEDLDGLAYNAELPSGDYLFIDVTDDGCGMAPDVMARVFDPFFTTKKEGRGLGLATVIGIVRAH